MKKLSRILVLLLALSLCLTIFAACDPCSEGHSWVNGVCSVCNEEYDLVDYVSMCKMNLNSPTIKEYGSNIVRMYIDGDTTHFNVTQSDAHPEGVLKARYLAVNTPESTGQIEPYGKLASNYTHDTLQAAIDNGGSVLVESDTNDGIWNTDSYGRTLAWVWYKANADADWRNLNIELLQLGLGYGSNPGQNRYADYCVQALNQALQAKLIVHSQLPDPDFYYGDELEIDLKELRTNPQRYDGYKVAFEGYVTNFCAGSSYIQSYDTEDGIFYGISVYYNGSNSRILSALEVGNHVRVVGKVSAFNGTWQVSSLTYNTVNSKDPNNTVKVDDEVLATPAPEMTIMEFFANKTVEIINDAGEKENKTYQTCQLLVDTSVTMTNLYVYDAYTTKSGTSKGAMSLYCRDSSGKEITIRTEILYKKVDGKYVVVEQSEFLGKNITVMGVVDHYNYDGHNEFQIRVLNYTDIVLV